MQPTAPSSSAWRLTWLLIPALLALLLVLAPAPGIAEDEKEGEPKEGKEDEAQPAPEPKKREPLLPLVEADPKAFKDLVEASRRYFDLDEELWKGRKELLQILEAMGAEDRYPLKDMEFMRWLAYQSRSFNPEMKDRKWQRAHGINEAKSLSGTLYWLKSEDLTITFSTPRKYPKLKALRTKNPRIPPYPLLLSMHEKQDYTNQRFPGEVLAKRRFPKDVWGDLYDEWIVLIPEAAAGNYLNPNGEVRTLVFRHPYSVFWKHYHIDFERVILDGTEQAFAVANSMPIFFAGIVFRGKWKLESDEQKATVRNFAHVPVYVVDNPELAQQLEDAGHPAVTKGISGPILLKWMEERKRSLPKKFEWSTQRQDQVLAYWVNQEIVKWSDAERTLAVEVVDTPEEPNTIKIDADGFIELSLYLNDEIVDLDRKVRVVINENLEHDAMIGPADERMQKLGRDLDLLFNREPVRIRESMFFGWLMTGRIVQLKVRPRPVKEVPVTPEEPPQEGPQASAEQERRAERYMQKAIIFADKGNTDQAIEYLKKILALPKNKQTDDAQKKLEELEGS